MWKHVETYCLSFPSQLTSIILPLVRNHQPITSVCLSLYILYHFILLRLDLPVLWFDFHLVLLQNPFLWLPKAVEGRLEMSSYREPCQRYCVTQGEPVSWQTVAET